ncbi:hypothetical protein GCM10009412_39790 [Aeromonas salmonicida subsp. achromogenes]
MTPDFIGEYHNCDDGFTNIIFTNGQGFIISRATISVNYIIALLYHWIKPTRSKFNIDTQTIKPS